jgi:uncharacterized protein YceH (UPF0502 family)
VLGSLLEKEVTTPDSYPLTLNALVAACNQTSNREPVMALDDDAVSRALDELRRRSLVRAVQHSGSRTTRYSQLTAQAMNLDAAERAVMCVLMLRGPQTVGEIKGRTERLFIFDDLAHLEQTLELLSLRQPEPLVTKLPRRPGQKEVRWAHLLAGEVVEAADAADAPDAPRAESRREGRDGRVEALEQSVEALRAELAELRAQFEAFRREFQ